MISYRQPDYRPATPADLVADILVVLLGRVPEISEWFEILPRWDDAGRDGPFCAVTASEVGGVRGWDGEVAAPAVDVEVSLCSAPGDDAERSGFHEARAVLARLMNDAAALRREIADAAGVGVAVSAATGEDGSDGDHWAATFRVSVQLAAMPALPREPIED